MSCQQLVRGRSAGEERTHEMGAPAEVLRESLVHDEAPDELDRWVCEGTASDAHHQSALKVGATKRVASQPQFPLAGW